MPDRIDFQALAADLLSRAESLLPQWFPGGVFKGREFVVGGLNGEPGHSLSVNSVTGAWADFATDVRGGDLISLYAAMRGLKQGAAAVELSGASLPVVSTAARKREAAEAAIGQPPPDAPACECKHPRHGKPSTMWRYLDAGGRLIHYVARYDPAGERKQIIPWSWDLNKRRWRALHMPPPRPLYGLHELAQRPDAPVLVVEGEKAADAAAALASQYYVCVTWSGGSQAMAKVDWRPLVGRKLLLWPDADTAGTKAMAWIAREMDGKATEIKLIDPTGQPDGWDAADALADGWGWNEFVLWAKPRAAIYGAAAPAPEPEPEPEQSEPAVTVADEAPTEYGMRKMWLSLGLDLSSSGVALPNLNNVVLILERHPLFKGKLWYDEFYGHCCTTWRSDEPREWSEQDDRELTLWCQQQAGILRMGTIAVHDAAMLVAHRRVRHELREWMDALAWDGEPRVDLLVPRGFGAVDTEYSRRVGACWMLSMAARAHKPGCKADALPVFEGQQGVGKSSALAILGGKWFTECHESILTKDFYGVLEGHLLVEISEMHAFARSEVERIKGVISCSTDRYRAPYGRYTENHPRTAVFAGTTNRDDWNRDETGARRFWPVRCGKIDLDWLAANREQLFAEAVVRYGEGEDWWYVPPGEAHAEQEERRQADTWEDVVEEWIQSKAFGVRELSTRELLEQACKIEPGKQEYAHQRRIASVMRQLGWTSRICREEKRSMRKWVRADDPQPSS